MVIGASVANTNLRIFHVLATDFNKLKSTKIEWLPMA
jgi:hypothetical protein